METRTVTDPEAKDYGTRYVYDDDGTIYTWDEWLARDNDDDPNELLVGEILDPTPTTPPPSASPKLEKAVAKYVLSHRIVTTTQLLNMPEPEWFIERLVPKSPILVLHGPPGSRKTFLALDWAVCAQHELDWHGKRIAPGPVLYILGEGVQGLPKRLRALAHSKSMQPEDIKVTWMAEPLNLFQVDNEQVDLWAAFVRHFKFRYVVIDTLHKNMAGGEENSAKEVGLVFANAKKIAGDADLIFVHHDTKAKAGTRGSGSIDGDSDTVLQVSSTGNMTSKLSSDKIRDAEAFDHLELTFNEHEESDSIYIATVGDPAPNLTKRQAIINFLRAEPRVHIRKTICCAVGDGGNTQDAFKSLVDDKTIYSESIANPNRGKGHSTRIDVYSVDEDEINLLEGTALHNADD